MKIVAPASGVLLGDIFPGQTQSTLDRLLRHRQSDEPRSWLVSANAHGLQVSHMTRRRLIGATDQWCPTARVL
jgi:hypothetical protein